MIGISYIFECSRCGKKSESTDSLVGILKLTRAQLPLPNLPENWNVAFDDCGREITLCPDHYVMVEVCDK